MVTTILIARQNVDLKEQSVGFIAFSRRPMGFDSWCLDFCSVETTQNRSNEKTGVFLGTLCDTFQFLRLPLFTDRPRY